MDYTKASIRSDFSQVRFLMREWERVLKETPDDHDALLDVALELTACANSPLAYLAERGITR